MKTNCKSKKFVLISIISAVIFAATATLSITLMKKHRK